MKLNRRDFTTAALTGAATLYAPWVAGQTRPKVVVIGGGAGGATAARYLARDSQAALDISLIEANPIYTTCFFSNLYLGGFRDFESLQHGYSRLADLGIGVINDIAIAIDRDTKSVTTKGGQTFSYDRLILAPGIDFRDDSVAGWSIADQEIMPHAYKAGPQTKLLKAQIAAIPQGGTFAMIAPPNPYRCPPGPYERVSLIANWFLQTNPSAKILLIDPKDKYSKQALFEEAWQKYYGTMIERVGPEFGSETVELRPDTMEIVLDDEVTKVDCCNVIPGQMAGKIAQLAGVTDESGWAPVKPQNMQSRLDANIYVLGDSAAQGDMPKSAFSANSQAKVAAMTIRAELLGTRLFPAKYSNTCWSLLGPEDGVKVGAIYEATEEKITAVESFISHTDEDALLRKATFDESLGWYAGITADIFG